MHKNKELNTKRLYFSDRIKQILSGLWNYPLTIVDAPMGYGKTTAVRELVGRPDARVYWLRVRRGNPFGFWKDFIRLTGMLDKENAGSLTRLEFPGDSATLHGVLPLFSGLHLSCETIIVIDDYHELESDLMNTFFEYLAQIKVPDLHIVLIARFTKFRNITELSLKNCVCHITKEIFELSPDDILQYFRVCGITLKAAQAELLYSLTEGWISALYLLLLEYASKGSFTNAESIYRLIETAVYLPLREEVKEFLLSMCVFSGFSLSQAQYVLGERSATGILSELTEGNSFVKYERRLKTYYIHSIFLNFLREKVEDREDKKSFFEKAAHWFQKIKDYPEARRFFYLCGNFDSMLQALEIDTHLDYSTTTKDALVTYLAACPEEVKARHPFALLQFALLLLVHNEVSLFQETCCQLRASLECVAKINPVLSSRLSGELELLLSFTEFSDLKKMSARHRKAWELLNQPASVYNSGVNWAFGSPSVLSLYYRESGRLDECIEDMKEGLPFYSRLANGQGAGAEYAMEAESRFNRGDFDDAEILAQKALLKARNEGDESIACSAQYLQTLSLFMKGNLNGVWALMNQMHTDLLRAKNRRFLHPVEICEGCIYAYLDQADRVPETLLDSRGLLLQLPAQAFYNVMLGRVLLIRGEYLKLIGSADHFLRAASALPNMLGHIYTYIYLAAANWRIYREGDAVEHLLKALELAMPDRQFMLFAENCDYIAPVLEKISALGRYREEIGKILSLGDIFRRSKERMIFTYFTEEKPKLTSREAEVARLVSEGFSNREIGKRLFISENTVKSALKYIYSKLSINNRNALQDYLSEAEELR